MYHKKKGIIILKGNREWLLAVRWFIEDEMGDDVVKYIKEHPEILENDIVLRVTIDLFPKNKEDNNHE